MKDLCQQYRSAKMGAEVIPGLLESIRKETSEQREYGKGKKAPVVKAGKSVKTQTATTS